MYKIIKWYITRIKVRDKIVLLLEQSIIIIFNKNSHRVKSKMNNNISQF